MAKKKKTNEKRILNRRTELKGYQNKMRPLTLMAERGLIYSKNIHKKYHEEHPIRHLF